MGGDRFMKAKSKKLIEMPTSWDHEDSQARENNELEGIGRTGTQIRSLAAAGLSRDSAARIREMGFSRIGVARPGGSPVVKASLQSKIKK
jgi:hypothetical protein